MESVKYIQKKAILDAALKKYLDTGKSFYTIGKLFGVPPCSIRRHYLKHMKEIKKNHLKEIINEKNFGFKNFINNMSNKIDMEIMKEAEEIKKKKDKEAEEEDNEEEIDIIINSLERLADLYKNKIDMELEEIKKGEEVPNNNMDIEMD